MAELLPTNPVQPGSARTRWVIAGAIIGLALFCAFMEASQNYIGAINFGRPVTYRESMRRTFPSWVIVALLTPLVIQVARRFPIARERRRRTIAAHVASAITFALVHLGGTALVFAAVDRNFGELRLLLNKFISAYFMLDVLLYCGIVGSVYALHYYREAKAREVAASRLQESLTQARLAALRGQLNPHFLFNTLNAISTMALKREHDNVVLTLGYLSELLRVSLDDRLPQEVALADELELLDRYLEIQRVRFGDRLTVRRDIDESVLDALVPIMILQPLAENAIVHGIASVPGPGEVRLSAERRNGELVMEVSDTGRGFASTKEDHTSLAEPAGLPDESGALRSGIGLANTRARLAQLYGDRSRLDVSTGSSGGARVAVTIPYRVAPSVVVRPRSSAVVG